MMCLTLSLGQNHCEGDEYPVAVAGGNGVYCVQTSPCSGQRQDPTSIRGSCPSIGAVNSKGNSALKNRSCCVQLSKGGNIIGCVQENNVGNFTTCQGGKGGNSGVSTGVPGNGTDVPSDSGNNGNGTDSNGAGNNGKPRVDGTNGAGTAGGNGSGSGPGDDGVGGPGTDGNGDDGVNGSDTDGDGTDPSDPEPRKKGSDDVANAANATKSSSHSKATVIAGSVSAGILLLAIIAAVYVMKKPAASPTPIPLLSPFQPLGSTIPAAPLTPKSAIALL